MKITIEFLLLVFVVAVFTPTLFYVAHADDTVTEPVLDENIKAEKVPLQTDDHTVQREAEAISPDGFSVVDRAQLRNEEAHQFQAEIPKLMDIIVKSLYSNKDIFIRELVSNAADALSKIRFTSLTDPSVLKSEPKLEIKITVDSKNNLLHIRDTGIGMTKKELVNNLGSIAKSGTKEFIEKAASGHLETIGQFGVGFYSAFLVADKVTVTSKHNDDEQHVWEGTGDGNAAFSVAQDPRGNTLGRGTLITLHLKEDAKKYASLETLKELILRFNEFIPYPIYIWSSKQVTKEAPPPAEEAKEATEEKADIEVKEDEDSEKPAEEEKKPEMETVWDWSRVNVNPPLWTQKKGDINEEDYFKFFKDVLRDSQDPLYYTHFKAEGDVEFNSLLFIPQDVPFGFWEPGFKPSMKLYVKRVFITEDFTDMLPAYLNFIKGIVDSDDLPLNVSREILQQNKTLSVIKKKLVRKIIAMFQELADKPELWDKFWDKYSTNIKLGVVQDTTNRTRLSKLVRFQHAKDPKGKPITFDQYVEKMKKGQEEIYYLGGESKEQVLSSPLLERLLKRGYDVLLLTAPIDEYCVNILGKFDGKYTFVDVSKEGLKLKDEDQEELKKTQEEFQPLSDALKKTLEDKVLKVEVSTRLTKTPSALVATSWGYSANMERIMKAQALKDDTYSTRLGGKRVLEINARHPIVKKLLQQVKDGKEEDPAFVDVAHVLYDTAVLNSGYALNEPTDLTTRINRMVSLSLNLDPNEQPEEETFVEEPEAAEEPAGEEASENKAEEEHEEL